MIFHDERLLLTAIKQAIDGILADQDSSRTNAGVLHYLSELLADLVMIRAQPDDLRRVRDEGYAELLRALGHEQKNGYSSYEKCKADLESRLQTMIAAVRDGQSLSTDLAPFYGEAYRFANRLHDQKTAFRKDLQEEIASRNERLPKIPNVDQFQHYLEKKIPGRTFTVHRLNEVSGGFSKNVISARISGLAEDTEEFIIRMDVKAGVSRTRVSDEYRLLRSISGKGVAIPELVFNEENLCTVGEPFYVMKRARGEPSGDFVMPNDKVEPEHGHDLARNLGRLHSIPLEDLDLPDEARPLATIADAVRYNVDKFYSYFQLDKFQAEPLITAGYLWLFENRPTTLDRPVLLHGDPAFNNILIDQDSIVAVVDWEYAHLGDPAEDISYVKAAIESFMPWEDFLNSYYEAGGRPYDENAGNYYKIWREMRNVTATITGQRSFRDGRNTHSKLPFATTLLPRIYLDALATMRLSHDKDA